MRSNMTGAGRYKLIQLLREAEGFECYAALDIETSQRENVLLNIYSGAEEIRRVVPLYFAVSPSLCPAFCRVYTEDSRFTAVFRLSEGEDFTAYFARRDAPDAALRLAYAETLLHGALENAQLPGSLLCAVLREENLVVQEKNHRICLNFCVPPVEKEESAPLLLSPLIEKTLRRKWSATDEQIDWMDQVRQGEFESLSALYSAWRAINPIMQKDLEKSAFVAKLLRFIKRSIRRGWKKWKQNRKRKKELLREQAQS